jgi:hypothetical protein
MSIRLVLTACAVAALSGGLLVAPAQAGAPAAGTTLETRLRPSGDLDGRGEATVRLNADRGRVCATITWANIQAPQAAHIHKQSNGEIVVDLTGAVTGGQRCTAGVSSTLIAKIVAHPRRYWVNVHNATYPAGAIQGTLHR